MKNTSGRRSVFLAAMVAVGCTVCLNAASRASTDIWTNQAGTGNWSTSATDANWSIGGVQSTFTNGDSVIFDDTAGFANTTIQQIGAIAPASVAVADPTLNCTFLGIGFHDAGALTKSGAGMLELANNVAEGPIGGTNILAGTLDLNFVNLPSSTNLIIPSSALSMSGGTLDDVASVSTTSQTFNGTTFAAGGSSINLSGTGFNQLTLGQLHRSQGATVNFAGSGPHEVTVSSANAYGTGASAILGGYATLNQTDWAVVNLGNDIVGLSTLGGYTPNTWAPGDNTDITSTGLTFSGSTQSLRFNSNLVGVVNLATGTSIASGGILLTANVGGNSGVVQGGTLTSDNTEHDLVISQYDLAGFLLLRSQIIDNGVIATGLTKSGPGFLALGNTGNTYSGPTTIDGGVLTVPFLAPGGSPSLIGQSSANGANLVFNGGALQFTGANSGSTNRQFTLGPNGATLDGSGTTAMDFSGTGAATISNDAPTSLTLTGSYGNGTSTWNELDASIGDGDISGTFKTSLVKSGTGAWLLTNSASTYSGGTTINSGVLKIQDSSSTTSSALGTGPVIVNNGGTLGGGLSASSFVYGLTTVNGGGSIVPGDATNMTFQHGLVLNPGAGLTYTLNTPGLSNAGPGGGNDLITSSTNVTIGTNIPVSINPGVSFGSGTYSLIQYGNLTDNSHSFQGWTATLQTIPAALASTKAYYTMSILNNVSGKNIDLVVDAATTTPPTLTSAKSSTTLILPANMKINNSAVNNPVVSINAPVNNGNIGGNNGLIQNFNFFMANGGLPVAKGFSFAWVPVLAVLPAGTPYFNISTLSATQTTADPNTAAGGGNIGGWAYAGLVPTNLGGALNSGAGPNAGLADTGLPYALADAHYAAAPFAVAAPSAYANAHVGPIPGNVWLPAFLLAPLMIVVDPPATPVPTYYGESFVNPNGDLGLYLALDENGTIEPAVADDFLGGPDGFGNDTYGELAVNNFQGSFLSLVESDFPSITDVNQLSTDQWDEFDGSFGIDPANSIAWAVDDEPDADYTVVGIGTGVPEPTSLGLLGATGLALLSRRKRHQ
jgi:fibronectin-binding autotransporter adhesin